MERKKIREKVRKRMIERAKGVVQGRPEHEKVYCDD